MVDNDWDPSYVWVIPEIQDLAHSRCVDQSNTNNRTKFGSGIVHTDSLV